MWYTKRMNALRNQSEMTHHPLNKSRWLLLLLLVAAAAVSTALTTNLGAYAHDAAAEHIPRGLLFSAAIADGNFFPAWTQFLHVGLGSPLFTFQPPLPYYGMDLLARLGLAHPLGWRVLLGGGLLVAFLGAFALVHLATGRRWAGLATAASPDISNRLRIGVYDGSDQ